MNDDKKSTKCDCPAEHVLMVQYEWHHPEHYDGVSEYKCENCGRRWGRWSGKELTGDEREPRYGGRHGRAQTKLMADQNEND